MLLGYQIVSIEDHYEPRAALERAHRSWLPCCPACLKYVGAEPRAARAVLPTEIPDDPLTMNSRFFVSIVEHQGRLRQASTLVYRESEAVQYGRLSVFHAVRNGPARRAGRP